MPSPNWLSKGWEEMEAPEDQGLAGERLRTTRAWDDGNHMGDKPGASAACLHG